MPQLPMGTAKNYKRHPSANEPEFCNTIGRKADAAEIG
jgi:hypothetical protein